MGGSLAGRTPQRAQGAGRRQRNRRPRRLAGAARRFVAASAPALVGPLKIGEVARRAGVGIHAIRYYEREGLIGRAERLPSGYRVFGEQVLRELRFITGLQALGFRNPEIRQLAQLPRRGLSPCGSVKRGLRRRLAEVDGLLADVRAYRRVLFRLAARWRAARQCAPHLAAMCALLEGHPISDQEVSRAKALSARLVGRRLTVAGRAPVRQ